MVVKTETVDLPRKHGNPMRMLVASPAKPGTYPGILFYSDIFQLTGTMIRSCVRLAGYGFLVAAPEIYNRIESPGTVIAFDDAGRTQGLEDAAKTSVAEFDADCRQSLDFLKQHPFMAESKLGAAGFCIGGHLAFRAALQSDVKATVCFYPTGVHSGKLGKEENAGTLERIPEIRGMLLLIFGTLDPHIPEDGRSRIRVTLQTAGTRFEEKHYPAEHAFMRDEGPRYDPEATDLAWNEAIRFFREHL